MGISPNPPAPFPSREGRDALPLPAGERARVRGGSSTGDGIAGSTPNPHSIPLPGRERELANSRRRVGEEPGERPVLAAYNLELRLGGRLILDIPSLEVREGEVLAIIGPNGSGKSSLLQTLALLQPPTAGRILFRGQPVDYHANPLPFRRRMAVVFQEPLLLSTSVYDNVALGLSLRGRAGGQIKPRVFHWLERLGVAHLARRPAGQLSGGEAQRVSLARALALEPEVLLLDEPFSALDAPTRAALQEDLEPILRGGDLTSVFVTHDRAEALALGDRIAVLMDGRLCQLGTPQEVFSSPATEEVAAFVGVETILPGEVLEAREGLSVVAVDQAATPADAEADQGRAGVSPGEEGARLEVVGNYGRGQKVLVCLRPEDVTISLASAALRPTSARNSLSGTISRLSPLGPLYRVVVDCAGFPVVSAITRRSCLDLGLEMGQTVVVTFKATAVHIIKRD